jgi:hypothetical protein
MPTVHDVTVQYQGVMVAILMVVALLQLTYGYKLKKLTFTTLGASAAGYGMYYLFLSGTLSTQDIYVEIAITSVASLLGAALMYTLGNKLEKTALFAVGASSGLYGIYALRLVVPALTNTVWGIQNFPMWVIGIISGLLIGYFTFKLERTIFITATSAGGAFLFVSCLAYYLKPDLTAASNQRWIYLGIMVALFLLGLLIQFMYTAPKEKKKAEVDIQRNLLEYEESSNLGYGATNEGFRNNPVYEQA